MNSADFTFGIKQHINGAYQFGGAMKIHVSFLQVRHEKTRFWHM